jgi:hypothetical protein
MHFKSIREIFKRVSLSDVKTPLGRWNINNYRETSLKIKYATEDNCGISCHNYKNKMQMQPMQPMQPNELEDETLYIYMMDYEPVDQQTLIKY